MGAPPADLENLEENEMKNLFFVMAVCVGLASVAMGCATVNACNQDKTICVETNTMAA